MAGGKRGGDLRSLISVQCIVFDGCQRVKEGGVTGVEAANCNTMSARLEDFDIRDRNESIALILLVNEVVDHF